MNPIFAEAAPKPIGPYSQAVRAGDWLFISGQIPLDPASGTLAAAGICEQARQALRNLGAILSAAGAGPEHVVKTTVYTTDLAHFAEVNAVYAEFFHPPYPARAVIEVSALPAGASIEIEAIAHLS